MKYIFKEPINKRIISLFLVFIIAIILIVFLNNSRSEFEFELNTKLDNARNGQLLSSKIIVNLHYLHSQIINLMKPDSLVMLFPQLDEENIFLKMENIIDEIKKILHVLRENDNYKSSSFDALETGSHNIIPITDIDRTNINLLNGILEKLSKVESFIFKIQQADDVKSIIPNSIEDRANLLITELIDHQGNLYDMINQIESYFFIQINKMTELKKEGRIQSKRFLRTYFFTLIIILLLVFLFGIRIIIQVTEIVQKRDKAEFDTKRAKEYAENLYKVSPIAIFTIDQNRMITNWNLRAEEITGYSYSEIKGNICSIFTESPCRCNCEILNDSAKSSIFSNECLIKTKSGEFKNVYKNAISLRDDNGVLIGGIESFIDITEQKDVHRKIELAMHEAEESARVKSEFLANMSHELRTPLNSIIGFSDLLIDTKLDEKQSLFVDSISENGNSLIQLINDILDMSKLEVGKLSLELVGFDFKQLVLNIFNQIKLKNNSSNVEFKIDIDKQIPDILIGDPVRVKQIFMNLLDNASKFTLEGEIFLRTSLSLKKVSSSVENELFVDIYLKDTGIGIAKEQQEIIFDPFTQADSSTTRKYGGTGLGLSIVKSLVEMMDGTIVLNSAEKEGCEFLVTLRFKYPSSLMVKH